MSLRDRFIITLVLTAIIVACGQMSGVNPTGHQRAFITDKYTITKPMSDGVFYEYYLVTQLERRPLDGYRVIGSDGIGAEEYDKIEVGKEQCVTLANGNVTKVEPASTCPED